MEAAITVSIPKTSLIIDLEDYGFSPKDKWSELSDDQKFEVYNDIISELSPIGIGADYQS